MKHCTPLLPVAFALLAVAACGGDGTSGFQPLLDASDATQNDAGASDTGDTEDLDADVDDETDGSNEPETTSDTASDVERDAEPDVERDAEPDAEADAEQDVQPDAEPDAEADTVADAERDAASEDAASTEPCVLVEPSELDFGVVVDEERVFRELVVTNCTGVGGPDLAIDGSTVVGDDRFSFALVFDFFLPTLISPGDSIRGTVTYVGEASAEAIALLETSAGDVEVPLRVRR